MSEAKSNVVSTTEGLATAYRKVRRQSERLCEPLATEDYVVQSMSDVSPTRWHLAHATWFFETFVLKRFVKGYRSPDPDYEYLFNSYYNAVSDQYPRSRRGLLTRPTVAEVYDYRARVDGAMEHLFERDDLDGRAREITEIGIHHEQQHQELILMDIKHVLSCNPLHPVYRARSEAPGGGAAPAVQWLEVPAGRRAVGHRGEGFCYDNERPRHEVLVPAFRIASRLVTNDEYMEFIEAGGYRGPEHWLADGWTAATSEGWEAPLYWVRRDGGWSEFTLGGLRPLDAAAPVCHLSYYEADAFASWAGARLPSEAEWETVAAERPVQGNFLEDGHLHPTVAVRGRDAQSVPLQMFGDVWEWTRSAYGPYPGYRLPEGALGEYNGKFMCNQYVLRGGACATPLSHIRATYRNFFYPHQRWQFSGLRLARDA